MTRVSLTLCLLKSRNAATVLQSGDAQKTDNSKPPRNCIFNALTTSAEDCGKGHILPWIGFLFKNILGGQLNSSCYLQVSLCIAPKLTYTRSFSPQNISVACVWRTHPIISPHQALTPQRHTVHTCSSLTFWGTCVNLPLDVIPRE